MLPEVGSDGAVFLVAWQGLTGTESSFRGLAAAVSLDGAVGPKVETDITPQPKVSRNGPHYLAVGGGTGACARNVWAVHLNAGGSPLGTSAPFIRGTKAAAFCISPIPGRGWLAVNHRSKPDPWNCGGPGAIRATLVFILKRSCGSITGSRLRNQRLTGYPVTIRGQAS